MDNVYIIAEHNTVSCINDLFPLVNKGIFSIIIEVFLVRQLSGC